VKKTAEPVRKVPSAKAESTDWYDIARMSGSSERTLSLNRMK
jgi:hypothetical protein